LRDQLQFPIACRQSERELHIDLATPTEKVALLHHLVREDFLRVFLAEVLKRRLESLYDEAFGSLQDIW
jgi:hypothetical protein